ncbi:MAG: hypothetical protein OIN87_06735 [Candidatus Methanoperedens sp.]|nr:hypothetical protein [Candidatus Methanoperedens sp.]
MAENDIDVTHTIETEVGGVKKTLKKYKRKCTVVRVAQAKGWRNVVVLDTKEGKKYFFGKVSNAPPELAPGEELFIGFEEVPYELPGIKHKIILMTLDGFQLDWTMV